MLNISYSRTRCADAAEVARLYVITVINNPEGWRRRVQLMHEFRRHMEEDLDLKARLIVVECAYGNQEYVCTDRGNPLHVQVRSDSELWIKEALINRGLAALPADAKYVAWIDADVFFVRSDVLLETVHALQNHPIVQMFRHCSDMGPDGEVMHMHESFGYGLAKRQSTGVAEYKQNTMHTGYAWAARVAELERVGGLFDKAILGSGDHVMAHSIIGTDLDTMVPRGMQEGYMRAVREYSRMCGVHFGRDVGYVEGTILHAYHGDKAKRQYNTRSQILVEHKYDPETDIRKNRHGVYEFVTDLPSRRDDVLRLRDAIRTYNRDRHEDATSRTV